jgi:4-hydroxy-2-oxoglutarate aldolase
MSDGVSLEGVFAPIPTPFDDSGAIQVDRLAENLDRWNRDPLAGIVVGGSNGEFPLLSVEERVSVVSQVRRRVPGDRLVFAGSGMESTAATIDLTRRMADAGADAALVVTPSYYRGRMDGPTLVRHFLSVAESSSLPIILYNVPANTAVDLSADAVIELSRHPNIVGIKDSGGDLVKMARIVGACDPAFQVMAGSAGFFLAALSVGAVGVIAALANLAAPALVELMEAHRRADPAAKMIQARLIPINAAVTSGFGVPGLKSAMDWLGMYGGPPRPPLLPLGEPERDRIRRELTRAGLIADR